MGSTRCSFTCLISSTTSQRPGNLYGVVSTYQQHPRQEERHRQEAHSHSSCHQDFLNKLTWLQVTSMVPHGGTAAKTTSALLTKHLWTVSCPRHRAPHQCGDLDPIPDNWADVCGFLKPPGSQQSWKVDKHGEFSIPRKSLGLCPNDQSCHHEAWLHLHFVDWSNRWSKQDDYDRHISLKERPAACSYGSPKTTY